MSNSTLQGLIYDRNISDIIKVHLLYTIILVLATRTTTTKAFSNALQTAHHHLIYTDTTWAETHAETTKYQQSCNTSKSYICDISWCPESIIITTSGSKYNFFIELNLYKNKFYHYKNHQK